MKKTISVKKLLRGSFIALLCLLAAIIAVYGTYSIRTYADYVLGATEEQLAAYAMRLEEEMDDLAAFNLELTRNDSDFAMLSFPDCSEKQTLLSMYNLRRIFSAGIDEYCAIILYDPDGVGLYFTFDDDAAWSLSALEKRRLVRDNLPLILEMGEPLSETWVELTGEYNASSLMTVNRNRNLHLATVLSLEQYIKRNTIPIFSPASIATIATEGRILLQEEAFENLGLTAEALAEMRGGKLLTSLRTGYLCKSVPVSGSSLYVTTLIPVRDLAHAMVPSVIFLALVLLLVTAAMIITYRLLVKLLYFPIEEAAQLSKHLNDLDRPRVLEGNRFVEFNEIMRATLDLLDQKELLEEEKNNQKFEKERAMFQFYQLQTRSHFFLNCLKSLYHMLENGEKQRMQMMIIAFSNHLRYIFRDSMQEVTLAEELQEVMDYHRIISLDTAVPLLLTTHVPDALLECYVPSLLIQTFLENTCKYHGRDSGQILFDVEIAETEVDGDPFLHIRMTDNGVGYPPEILKAVNEAPAGTYDHTHVGLNNLKRRMRLLYQDRCKFAFYNSVGGACSSIYLPKHEEKIQL